MNQKIYTGWMIDLGQRAEAVVYKSCLFDDGEELHFRSAFVSALESLYTPFASCTLYNTGSKGCHGNSLMEAKRFPPLVVHSHHRYFLPEPMHPGSDLKQRQPSSRFKDLYSALQEPAQNLQRLLSKELSLSNSWEHFPDLCLMYN